jgi:hypothetical protein
VDVENRPGRRVDENSRFERSEAVVNSGGVLSASGDSVGTRGDVTAFVKDFVRWSNREQMVIVSSSIGF